MLMSRAPSWRKGSGSMQTRRQRLLPLVCGIVLGVSMIFLPHVGLPGSDAYSSQLMGKLAGSRTRRADCDGSRAYRAHRIPAQYGMVGRTVLPHCLLLDMSWARDSGCFRGRCGNVRGGRCWRRPGRIFRSTLMGSLPHVLPGRKYSRYSCGGRHCCGHSSPESLKGDFARRR
mgnify:CR=1 FL=1